MSWSKARHWYFVAGLIVIVDQLTKFWVSSVFSYGDIVEILPILNLTLVHNLGAAFSFLSDAGGWQRWFFTVVSLVVSIILVVWLYRLSARQTLLSIALSFVLGGAIGNLLDRIIFGYVIDFIDFHYYQYHWPSFNIADAAITLGAVLLIIEGLWCQDQVSKADKKYREK